MPVKRTSIENLKSKINILEVVGRVTTLKKRGASYVGLSPFTTEKTPSFYVEPAKGVYYCFSSNKGGDVISFVQATEKLEFYEAVETLAERYNITLEYEEGRNYAPQNRTLKKELLEIHLYAAEYFHKAFMAAHPEAEAVREYWENNRKFSVAVAEDFQVGYAPVSSDKLIEKLVLKKFSYEALSQCGLYFVPRSGSTDYRQFRPRFRGRLMIPLRDTQGQVIGFTGRKLPATPQDDPAFEAKYVNSPETPIFKKGGMLFNFDRARMAVDKQGFFLMVEGQLDCIRASSSGFTATVAGQGTAVTPDQLQLIRRYHNNLRVFLDGDRAGQNAALRLLPMALAAELDVTFLKLPAGIDPDLFFVQNPGTDLKKLEVLYPMDFAISAYWPTDEKPTAQAKADGIAKIFDIIRAAPSAIAQEAMLEELTRKTHQDGKALRKDFEKTKNHKPLIVKEEAGDVKINKNLTNAESELLWLLVHHPDLGKAIANALPPEVIDENTANARLLNRILALAAEDDWTVPEGIEKAAQNDADRDTLFSLIARPLPPKNDPIAIANNSLKALYTRHAQTKLDEVKNELQNAPAGPLQNELLKKQQNLLISLKKIPSITHG